MESKSSFLDRYEAVFAGASESLRSADMAEIMYALCAYLDEERQKYNLTAIKDPAEVMSKHVYDCLCAVELIMNHAAGSVYLENISYLDVGSGAGFPALPAAALLLRGSGALENDKKGGEAGKTSKSGKIIAQRGGIRCRSVEASLKKCGFMNRAAALMGLPCAEGEEDGGFLAVQARAEAIGMDSRWREKHDIVTARAVADLPVLMELCLPLTRVGGVFAAMKGAAADDELARAGNAAKLLGAKLEAEFDYSLPDGAGERRVLIFRKTDATPVKYPRAYGKITAKPL